MTVSICLPTNSVRRCLFSTTSPAFIASRLFDDGNFDWCEMIPHCSFYFHFSNNEWCWASFNVFINHLYVFLKKCLFNIPVHIFIYFFKLNCTSCLYKLEINSLSVISFVINLSYSEGSLFTFLIGAFIVQKLLHLIRCYLFIFVFISIILGGGL